MKRFKLVFFFALCAGALGLGISNLSWAEPSCVDAPQPDGTTWRTCVDDAGRQYCESCVNGVCSRVSCSS